MTGENSLQERLEKLGQAIGSDDSLVENVMSRIDAEPVAESNRISKLKNKPIIRRFVMNRFTKFAAAAVIIIAALVAIHRFGGSIDVTTPAYGITDVPRLIKTAKTIHMKGWLYYPKTPENAGEPAKLKFEYWFDIENGRYRTFNPGGIDKDTGQARYYRTTISDGQYIMGETYHRPAKGKPWKSISFTKLSPFKARLEAYKNSHKSLMRMFGNIDQIKGSAKVGQEEIDGTVFDIWQNEFYLADGRAIKMRISLAPDSGKIGRALFWQKQRKNDPNWRLAGDYYTIELDVAPPAGIFNTEPPDGYILDNTKETAHISTLGLSMGHQMSMRKDYEIYFHVGFTLSDGSVIIAWSCPAKNISSQADLFEGLAPAGTLPELAARIEALTAIPSKLVITYIGRHLAYTQKDGNFYEWSLYVPDVVPPSRSSLFGYELNVKYNVDKNRFGNRPGNLTQDLAIDSSYDFNTWVRGAMAELSDDGKAPEGVTYESVLQLAKSAGRRRIE